jgi:hypothetical protein
MNKIQECRECIKKETEIYAPAELHLTPSPDTDVKPCISIFLNKACGLTAMARLPRCLRAKLGQKCEDVSSCTKVVNSGPSVVKDLVTTFGPPVQIGITNLCSPQECCRCDPRDLVSLDVERA